MTFSKHVDDFWKGYKICRKSPIFLWLPIQGPLLLKSKKLWDFSRNIFFVSQLLFYVLILWSFEKWNFLKLLFIVPLRTIYIFKEYLLVSGNKLSAVTPFAKLWPQLATNSIKSISISFQTTVKWTAFSFFN